MNKFQDNVQAATTEFTYDALLKFITRTIMLLEGGLLRSGFADRINASKGSGTTSRTNKIENRIVSTKQLAAESPVQPVTVNNVYTIPMNPITVVYAHRLKHIVTS